MRPRAYGPAAALVTFVCVSLMILVTALVPGRIGLGIVGFLLCWILFALWPWAVMPAGILGGTIAAVLVGYTDIASIVATHLLPLVAGSASLVTRRLLGLDRDTEPPVPRAYRLGMVVVLATTVIGALYGLAAGHAPKDVGVAMYQVAVIPVYFLVAAYTLDTPDRRNRAAVLYIGSISVLTAIELATPGRHGGLLSLLPVPLLIVLAGRTEGWKRVGLAGLTVLLVADVVLASYRGVWIAAGLALVVLVARGGAGVRRGLLAVGLAGVTLLVLLSLSIGFGGGLVGRLAVVGEALDRPAGYRVPEAEVGLEVFASQPLFGAGLGQSTPRTYIPGFAVTDVGPVYHSYYVGILANLGLIGLGTVLWPIARSVWTAVGRGGGVPLGFAALTCGFLVAAVVSGPSDGHWELGLLPALTLLTLRPEALVARRRRRGAPSAAALALAAGR